MRVSVYTVGDSLKSIHAEKQFGEVVSPPLNH